MGQTQTRQTKTQMGQTNTRQRKTQMGQTQTGQAKTQMQKNIDGADTDGRVPIADLPGEGPSSTRWAVVRTLIRVSLSPAEPLLMTTLMQTQT